MLELEQISIMQNVDIDTVDKSLLADVSGISFDNRWATPERYDC